MSQFEPDSFPRAPENRTLVWGEHDLSAVINDETDPGDGVEVMGFHLINAGDYIVVQPDGYLEPVAIFQTEDYNTAIGLMADLSAWSTMVWTEMNHEDRVRCFKTRTSDPEEKDLPGHVYIPDDGRGVAQQ